MTLFSDLIIIASDRANNKSFSLIVKAAAALLHECHIFKFPVNGCIACGELAFDEAESFTADKFNCVNLAENKGRKGQYMPLFVGKSIVDAYLLNEELFFYGVVLHPNAEKLLSECVNHSQELGTYFHKLPVPLKSGGNALLHYLDWTQIKLANNKVRQEDVVHYLDKMEESAEVRPRAYIHNTRNIIEYIERLKDNCK